MTRKNDPTNCVRPKITTNHEVNGTRQARWWMVKSKKDVHESVNWKNPSGKLHKLVDFDGFSFAVEHYVTRHDAYKVLRDSVPGLLVETSSVCFMESFAKSCVRKILKKNWKQFLHSQVNFVKSIAMETCNGQYDIFQEPSAELPQSVNNERRHDKQLKVDRQIPEMQETCKEFSAYNLVQMESLMAFYTCCTLRWSFVWT